MGKDKDKTKDKTKKSKRARTERGSTSKETAGAEGGTPKKNKRGRADRAAARQETAAPPAAMTCELKDDEEVRPSPVCECVSA